MTNCIFSLGIIDKRLYIPLLNIISYIVICIYYYFCPEDDTNVFIFSLGCSVGEMLTILIPYIFKYKNEADKKKTKIFTKKIFKDFSVYLILDLIIIIIENVIYQFEEEEVKVLFTTEVLNNIIIILVTIKMLKYKYYIHHIISLAIFLILSIIIDAILNNYEGRKFHILIFQFINAIFNVLSYCYLKYLMDVKYYYFWHVVFMIGFFDFIIYLLIFIILIILRFQFDYHDILTGFDGLNKENFINNFIRFFFGLFLYGLIKVNLEIQTINVFNPNHLFVCYEICNIVDILISAEKYEFFSIIPFILQIIVLLFYLEIFEFNFCGLNRNTKKNILLREKEEIALLEGKDNIELDGYFFFNDDEDKKNKEGKKGDNNEDNNEDNNDDNNDNNNEDNIEDNKETVESTNEGVN